MKNKNDNMEELINEIIVAHKSAIWWQEQMSKGLQELSELDKSDPYKTSEDRESIEAKVEYLIAKGEWEDRNLDKVMSQVEMLPEKDRRHIVSEIHNRATAKKGHGGPLD